jgi:hypothetical protein
MRVFMHCQSLVEAQHCVNLLLSAGIRAEVRNAFLAGAVGEIPFIEAGPQVWLDARQDPESARAILAEAKQADYHSPWRCVGCGEMIEGQFTACWNCGEVRPFAPN